MVRKHSPLPWSVYKQYHDDGHIPTNHIIVSGKDKFWAHWAIASVHGQIQDNDNAAFIVRACNSHYDLVEALEAMLGDNMSPAGEPDHIDYRQACKMARSALAKAKGEM